MAGVFHDPNSIKSEFLKKWEVFIPKAMAGVFQDPYLPKSRHVFIPKAMVGVVEHPYSMYCSAL